MNFLDLSQTLTLGLVFAWIVVHVGEHRHELRRRRKSSAEFRAWARAIEKRVAR